MPGRAEFTASTALTLAADTTYWVVLDVASGSGKLSVSTTSSDERDSVLNVGTKDGALAGWPFSNTMKAWDGTIWSDDADDRSFRMALNGTTDPHVGRLWIGQPQVGVATRPLLDDYSGRIKDVSWQWQRGDSIDGTFTNIPLEEGGTARNYVPSDADLDKWLKVSVTYEDGFGSGKSVSGDTKPVLSGPIVSNAGRVNTFGYVLESLDEQIHFAQAFTTGEDAAGYLLGGLRFGIDMNTVVDQLSWTLHAEDEGKPAEEPLFAPITVPGDTLDRDQSTFEDLPHPGFRLKPNTKYWAVLTSTAIYAADEDGSLCPVQPPGGSMTPVDDTQLTVQFEQEEYEAIEGCTVEVTVTLSKDPEQTTTIPIRATGSGYAGVPASVTFQAGQTEEKFTVTAVQDDDNANERPQLSFGQLPMGWAEGNVAESQVTIYDDDRAFLASSSLGEWGEDRVFEGIHADLDSGSEVGWSLDYSVLAKGQFEDEPRRWIPYSTAIELQRSKSVLRMSVLLHPDNVAPEFSSAIVKGTELEITFNEELGAAAALANSAFTVEKTPLGGSAEDVTLTGAAPVISGNTVTLTLDGSVESTDYNVKVSYAKPDDGTDNKLRDTPGNLVESFTGREVANDLRDAGFPGDHTVAATTDGEIEDGETVSGLLDPGRDTAHGLTGDYWRLEVQPGRSYRIEMALPGTTDGATDKAASIGTGFAEPGTTAVTSFSTWDDFRDDGYAFVHLDTLESNGAFRYFANVVAWDQAPGFQDDNIYSGPYQLTLTDVTGVIDAVHNTDTHDGTDTITPSTSSNLIARSGTNVGRRYAVGITTGPHTGGYVVDRIMFGVLTSGFGPQSPYVEVYSGSTLPAATDTPLCSTRHSQNFGQHHEFDTTKVHFITQLAPDCADDTLDASSQFVLVFHTKSSSSTHRLSLIPSDDEFDYGSGWSINDSASVQTGTGAWTEVSETVGTDTITHVPRFWIWAKKVEAGVGGQQAANTPAGGFAGVTGSAFVGETFTATTTDITDVDGMTDPVFTYQWKRVEFGGSDEDAVNIPGATGQSYTLTSDDERKAVWVVVSFTDDRGALESVPSNKYIISSAIEEQRDEEPQGDDGSAAECQGEGLVADLLDHPDTHDGTPFTFELCFNQEPARGLSFRTIRDYVFDVTEGTIDRVARIERGSGKRWRITVDPAGDANVVIVQKPTISNCESWRAVCTPDGTKLSGSESFTVDGPASQERVNNVATGEPEIDGTAEVGETLTATTSNIADADGMTNAVFTYQWKRIDPASTNTEGEDIPGATGQTYTVALGDLTTTLRVVVTFTDDADNVESIPSPATEAVTRSDFDAGDGQDVLASALIEAGDRGRKNNEDHDRAWYATTPPTGTPQAGFWTARLSGTA